jgi:hypothetical protein
MSRTYWVKKNPNCNKDETQWIEMNGNEFYKFIISPKGKGRYFIDFDDYKIEATIADYVKWRSEKDHSDYLREKAADYITISLYAMETADGCNGEDVIGDVSINVEIDIEKLLMIENLREVLLTLPSDERSLIQKLFLCDLPKTERALSVLEGIPQKTINDRKNRILVRLKNLLEKTPLKSKKSSQ